MNIVDAIKKNDFLARALEDYKKAIAEFENVPLDDANSGRKSNAWRKASMEAHNLATELVDYVNESGGIGSEQ